MATLRPIVKSCRKSGRTRMWFVTTGALLVGALAIAQDNTPTTLTPANDSLTQANSYMSKMRDTEKRVTQIMEQARNKKDIVKLGCVNDKLVQVRSHLIVADQSMSAFNAAAEQGDKDEKSHALSRVAILYEKVLVLRTEAENCIGEEASYVGKTQIDVEIDSSVPEEDPTQFGVPILEVVMAPAASPFI